ncbi:hypothetical protein H0H87_009835 [Tephrocybe sp. NHM501043]|nr:hypothetical protein H0H87_009835 [Tephrocybe sp. NHM501043]
MLCSLALAASELQPEAEEKLYSSIAVSADRIDSLQHVFETLETNPQKAGFVRFLTVEAMTMDPEQTGQNYIAVQELLALLPKLISLTDLRLKIYPWSYDPLLESMLNHPHLHIALYPAFQPAGMDGILSRVLKPAINRDIGIYEPLDCDSIGELYLFFETLEDTDYVSRYILDAAQCFPNVQVLVLLVQRSFKLVSDDIGTIITPLRNLKKLSFMLYMGEEDDIRRNATMIEHSIDKKTKVAYARQWQAVCPELERVYFYHGLSARRIISTWAVLEDRLFR